jgi:alanine racemase
VCAVVKANGYGHGLVEAARVFVAGGASMLGVTRLEEAATLREGGVEAPVLIMAPGADPARAVELRCAFALDDESLIDQLPAGSRVHLKVDTGMGRFGVHLERARDAAYALSGRGMLEGVFTHLPDATDRAGREAVPQFSLLAHALRADGMTFTAHLANSAGLLALPEARFDMVRVGTLLYGQNPPGVTAPWTHASTFAWYARVSSVRTLRAHESLGYGREYIARRPTQIATVPIGWADGVGLSVEARSPEVRERAARISRALRADRRHLIGVAAADGVPYEERVWLQVLGRIGMQATTVADPHAILEPGSIVQVPARRLTVAASIPRVVV